MNEQEYTVEIFKIPGCVAHVYIPVLTEEERARRMKRLHDAAANLLKEKKR